MRPSAEAPPDAAIAHALDHGEFTLHYQPKVSLVTNRIVGFEALVRWQRPGHGLLGPSEFIPRAEVTGQVVALGEWVMHEACRQIVAWQRAFVTIPLTIEINISPRQFREGLEGVVGHAVASTGIDANAISLALTETAVMDDVATSIRVLETVKHLGVRFSVDDFGVGYSSLNHLRRMPLDEIKIDRSFIEALGHSSVDTAIVASIISLAHAMGADAACDGVETLDQLERLRALGADAAQGYVFAPPLPASEVDDMLAADAMGERWPSTPARVQGEDRRAGETVLIVDEAADVRQLAAIALTPAGFRCHEVGSASAGIAMARRLQPDCVLIEVNLPDMSGIEVCRTLRNDPATSDCAILMLTTADRGSTKAEAFLLGADDYIVKPFSPRELTARIRAAQQRRRAATKADSDADVGLIELVRARQDADAAADEASIVESEALSERQLEIVERLLRGERVPTIAKSLYLSQSTVRNHLSIVFRKLGVASQEELLLRLRSTSPTP